MSAPSTLRAETVSRDYSGVRALDGVSFQITRGEIVGLIGPNGAGKSTLVNLLSGFDRPTTGSIHLGTGDITTWSVQRRVKAGLTRTFQHGHVFGGLTARENVEVAALGVGATRTAAAATAIELLELLGVADQADRSAATLSHGDERLVGVARALATSPSFVLLDEPAAGLNEIEVESFAQVVRLVAHERGAGVVLIDHNVPLVLGVSDRIEVLDQGCTLAAGTPAEIRSHPAVAEAYLGSAA